MRVLLALVAVLALTCAGGRVAAKPGTKGVIQPSSESWPPTAEELATIFRKDTLVKPTGGEDKKIPLPTVESAVKAATMKSEHSGSLVEESAAERLRARLGVKLSFADHCTNWHTVNPKNVETLRGHFRATRRPPNNPGTTADNGFAYANHADGRPLTAGGVVQRNAGARGDYGSMRDFVLCWGQGLIDAASTDTGHIVADSLGGIATNPQNFFPQDSTENRHAGWAGIEGLIRRMYDHTPACQPNGISIGIVFAYNVNNDLVPDGGAYAIQVNAACHAALPAAIQNKMAVTGGGAFYAASVLQWNNP